MDVVAEGVETAGQLAVLQDMGCRYLQGWLLGRPVDLAELPRCSTPSTRRARRSPSQKWTCMSTQWDGLVDAARGEAHSVPVPRTRLLAAS